uniref:Uncharacterized protein n=1 Tax=Grammatophora oceanica TaxID=210454 RepID=A0A7S1VSB5_9STRA|mmetsp:Transcript_5684/g.7998  ORF Transcript_5684/g.7998 Transcript_5684/m.7998 type:complete len:461 (+) Transcript_5684:147-1529(+)|eukprot:CAMPEP_0194047490 /NCGR_PEP_ID=MMETSP0009_2-20130614/24996_1 /TAXON_ID=210454 /ORGANISM="Grammatophora oceanica, Strain CCMP 410" /LENGTH=460 /DNA_ID=CAMNT_0038693139 /DNA_START=147 /DNA_END=1529 /DNA_ORIENTATION=-
MDSNRGNNELEVDFDRNMTKLYEAITSSTWNAALAAVNSNPAEARTWVVRKYENSEDIMWRFLPLHSACARQPPSDLMTALLKAYPEAALSKDDQGMYALHYACGNQASRDVIRQLLAANPGAAKMPDPRGMLPIHYLACWGPSSVSIIDMLLVANRNVGDIKDDDGNTPLSLAMEGEYPERDAVVSALRRWLDRPASVPSSAAPRQQTKDTSDDTDVYTDYKKQAPSPLRTTDTAHEAKSLARDTTNDRDSPVTVGRLRKEITTLKQASQAKEAEWEAKYQKDVTDLEVQLVTLQRDSQTRIDQLEQLLAEKTDACDMATQDLAKAHKNLFEAEEERDGVRQTLLDLTAAHDHYKIKAENMSDRLGSLNASLASMMDQQHHVMKSVQHRDAFLAEQSSIRRAKLQELIEIDERVLSGASIERSGCEEMSQGSEDSLEYRLQCQTKEMDAIAAVIAALRQ